MLQLTKGGSRTGLGFKAAGVKAIAVMVAIAASATSGAAQAADLPTAKAPPAPFISPWSWAGYYVGAYLGDSWGSSKFSDQTFPAFTGIGDQSSKSVTFGAINGYNFAFGSFVLGGELEFGYDDRKGSGSYLTAAGSTRDYSGSGDYIGRLRARAGYAWGRTLFFAAGGASVGDLNFTFRNPNNGFTQSISNTLTGYNVGGGVEYALTDNVILRAEYIYDKFASKDYPYHTQIVTGFDNVSVRHDENTARAAVTYKF
jgi:outer membrane immunogenic protein